MHSFIEGGLEFDLNCTKYTIIKSDENGIGESGIRQLSKCLWQNLSKIDLGEKRITKVIIILETLAASG